jgi:DNA repair protein RadC
METAEVYSFSFVGAQAVPAVVRVELSPGTAAFCVEGGGPRSEAGAIQARVVEALHACSLSLPFARLTVQVMSASPTLGRHLELPIAICVLAALSAFPTAALKAYAIFGALDPDGAVADVAGVEAAAIQARAHGFDLLCPHGQAEAVAVAGQAEVFGAASLLGVVNHFRGSQVIAPAGRPLSVVPTIPGGRRRRDHHATSAAAHGTDSAREDGRQGWLAALKSWVGVRRYPEARDAQDPLERRGGAMVAPRGFPSRPGLGGTEQTQGAPGHVLSDAPRIAGIVAPFASTGPHGHRGRMREKVLERGAGALADYEVLEMLLFLAFKSGDTKPLAKSVINHIGSFAAVLSAPSDTLMRVPGLGPHAVSAIKLVREAAERLVRAEVLDGPVLNDWDKLMAYLNTMMARSKIEHFRVLFLDTRNRLLADEELGRGTVNHLAVYPREVIKRALALGATAMILAHNHPSGDPTPSREDIEMTREIIRAAGMFSIAVHDHVVVGNGTWRSFRREGLLRL